MILGGGLPMLVEKRARTTLRGQLPLDAGSGSGIAFLWEKGSMTILPPMPGGVSSGASGINDSGLIVGTVDTDTGFEPFVFLTER